MEETGLTVLASSLLVDFTGDMPLPSSTELTEEDFVDVAGLGTVLKGPPKPDTFDTGPILHDGTVTNTHQIDRFTLQKNNSAAGN